MVFHMSVSMELQPGLLNVRPAWFLTLFTCHKNRTVAFRVMTKLLPFRLELILWQKQPIQNSTTLGNNLQHLWTINYSNHLRKLHLGFSLRCQQSAISLWCPAPMRTSVSSYQWFVALNGYAGGSLDFETSNNFFHQITEHSTAKIK